MERSKNKTSALILRREHGFPSFWNDYLGSFTRDCCSTSRPASWISFETSGWLSKRPSTSIPVVVPFPVAVTSSKTGQTNMPSRYLALEILAWYLTKAAKRQSIGHRSDRVGEGAKFRLTKARETSDKTAATVLVRSFVIYQAVRV